MLAHPPIAIPLSGVVIARNEVDRITRCVTSLLQVCAEVVVVDSFSTDGTQQAAFAAGARVIERAFQGFADQKNFAIAAAAHPWVLLLDADEVVAPALASEIRTLFAPGPDGAPRIERYDAYAIPRRNHFLGRRLRFGGWGTERVVRLFRRACRYRAMLVHETLNLDGLRVGRLRAAMLHDSYRSLEEMLAKLNRYSTLFATERAAQGRRATWLDVLFRPSFYWLKNYIFRFGFLDGGPGYILHRIYAGYTFDKYAKLWAMRHSGRDGVGGDG